RDRALRQGHGFPPHRRPIPRGLRTARARNRAEKPARGARPPRLGRWPRLSVPGARERPAALSPRETPYLVHLHPLGLDHPDVLVVDRRRRRFRRRTFVLSVKLH